MNLAHDGRAAGADAPPAAPLEDALRVKTIGFVHLLRAEGFTAGLQESEDALRIAELFLCFDFTAFHLGLRSLFCLTQPELEAFDKLFERYWRPRDGAARIGPPRRRAARQSRQQAALQAEGALQTLGTAAQASEPGETHTTTGATGLEALRRQDFSRLPAEQEADLARLAARLWRRMRIRRPSRLRGRDFKPRPHFRRILRRSLATGGEPLQLIMAGRRPRRPRLVVLLDVSGSMESYSLFYLRFLHALQHRFRRVHAFLFSTRLEDVTAELSARQAEQALERLSRRRLGWSSGTRIGGSLRALVRDHGARVFRSDTVLVILSDGLDVGEPEQLADALRDARRQVRRIVWLNPLLGLAGYEPIARGMAAALPLVDVFAPAHNLDSLLASERHLVV